MLIKEALGFENHVVAPKRPESGGISAPTIIPREFEEIALDFAAKINRAGIKNSPVVIEGRIGSERFRRPRRRGIRRSRGSRRSCGHPGCRSSGRRCRSNMLVI